MGQSSQTICLLLMTRIRIYLYIATVFNILGSKYIQALSYKFGGQVCFCGHIFLKKKKAFYLVPPPRQILFVTIFNQNIVFKTEEPDCRPVNNFFKWMNINAHQFRPSARHFLCTAALPEARWLRCGRRGLAAQNLKLQLPEVCQAIINFF